MNTLTLYVDARASHCRFAICGADRKPVWCGSFHAGEGRGQIAAELAAAKRAVLFASRTIDRPRVLILHSDAEWLAVAERRGSRTQPADWYTTSDDLVFPLWKESEK